MGDGDVYQDLNVKQVPLANSTSEKVVYVHRGFQQQYLSLRNEIHEKVECNMNMFDPAEILITGHSLGGALAKSLK